MLHHLRNNGVPWFQFGPAFCPSAVERVYESTRVNNLSLAGDVNLGVSRIRSDHGMASLTHLQTTQNGPNPKQYTQLFSPTLNCLEPSRILGNPLEPSGNPLKLWNPLEPLEKIPQATPNEPISGIDQIHGFQLGKQLHHTSALDPRGFSDCKLTACSER